MEPNREPKAAATLIEGDDPLAALDAAVAAVRGELGALPVTVATLFAASHYEPQFPALMTAAHERLGRPLLIGCSGEGVIGPRTEAERRPALSLLVQSLPDAAFRAVHLDASQIEPDEPEALVEATGVAAAGVSGWLLLADPHTVNGELLIQRFGAAYADAPLLGGMASSVDARRAHVFLNGVAYSHGVVGLAITRPYALRSVVSQGASPLGQPWTITGARANLVETIGGRPAYDVLVDTVRSLPGHMADRVAGGLLVGLAMNEYRDDFARGDFLIRNLLGYEPETRSLAINAIPRVGQTLQFQFRDARGADEDLRALLAAESSDPAARRPVAAILCSCNGRGSRMFDTPHHDAAALDETFAGLPVSGLFCAGEIGPVGRQAFLHGFTASIGLIVRE